MADKLATTLKESAKKLGVNIGKSRLAELGKSALRAALIQQALADSIREEERAINDYEKRANKADPKTAKVYKEIAREESHHKTELTNRLKQIR